MIQPQTTNDARQRPIKAGNGRMARPTVKYAEGWTDRIPAELCQLVQWVVWRYKSRSNCKGGMKWTKPPYQPHATQGRRPEAKTDDPATWGTHAEALATYQAYARRTDAERLDGIGFVFLAGDGFFGIDLDNCLTLDGKLMEWADERLRRLGLTYTEVTPSGRGLHLIFRGSLPRKPDGTTGRRRGGYGPDGAGEIEVYEHGRYFTMTGNLWPGAPATINAPTDGALNELAAALDDGRQTSHRRGTAPAVASNHPATRDASDDALLNRARNARNGAKFSALYDMGDCSGHPSASEADLALLAMLAFWTGEDSVRMERLFDASALGRRGKWADRPDYRAASIAEAIARNDGKFPSAPGRLRPVQRNGKASSNDRPSRNGQTSHGAEVAILPRPAIEVNTERHRVLAETLAVLPIDIDLYRRGNALVRVVKEEMEDIKLYGGVMLRNVLGSARVIDVSEAGLSCRLTALSEFFNWRPNQSGEPVAVPVHPPKWLMSAILRDGFYPGVRPLMGIAEVPFPRPDGTLVTEPGYDPTTGHLLVPSIPIDPIPDRPTQEDARAATALLLGLVYQFPFTGEDDAAVWLAALLTILARPGIAGPVPGFAFIGNRAGSGKGRLIDTLGMIAHGRSIPTSGYPRDDAEAQKTKVALALGATAVVHLDNLDEGLSYGGGALDSALTTAVVNDRILGQSKTTGEIPLRCVWMVSGNNIVPHKDADRRWLVCGLTTDLEHPEERDDLEIPDILGHIAARRGELVATALTILKAHALAGRPSAGWPPLGSFEEWDRIVRTAVWFALGRDCTASRRKVAEEAPERLDRLALLEAWAALPNGGPDGNGITAAEAVRLAEADKDSDIANALIRFSRDGKMPSPRVIGNRVRAIGGRNYGGMAFRVRGYSKRDRLWQVVKV